MQRLTTEQQVHLKEVLQDSVLQKAFEILREQGLPGGPPAGGGDALVSLALEHSYLAGYHDFAKGLERLCALEDPTEPATGLVPWGHIKSVED